MLRDALRAIPDEWGRPTGPVTRRGMEGLERRRLYEFRQIVDPHHTDTRFAPGLIGQMRLTPLGREVRAALKEHGHG